MKFLSVDPGSMKCGVVLWGEDQPEQWWLVECKPKMVFEERMAFIGAQIEGLARQHRVDLLVCEKPFNNPRIPGHEINMIFKRVRRVAKDLKLQWVSVHPSTVKARIRPRAFKAPETEEGAKAAVLMGCSWVYGSWTENLDPNVRDAIAVGHAHLCKQAEQETIQERELA